MQTIAALYVQTDGGYFGVEGVDAWDEIRDARLYNGPYPVVAHPPCQLWGPFAVINFARWGGEHNRPGNDKGCFASALKAVETWGGVLEHPKASRAWEYYGLARPSRKGWSISRKGSVCEVWQSAYGHKANKATWLYVVGLETLPDLNWSHPKGSHQIGFADQRGKTKNKPTISGRQASATPPEFKELLISIARSVKQVERDKS